MERRRALVVGVVRVDVRAAVEAVPRVSGILRMHPKGFGYVVREGAEDQFRPGDDLQVVCEVTNFGDSDLVGGVARLRMPASSLARRSRSG